MQAGHRVPPGTAGVRPPARARGSPHPHPGSSSGRGTARDPGAGPRPIGTTRAPSPRDTQEPITGPRGRAAGRSCLRWRGAHARRRRGRAGRGRARGSRPGVWIAPPARLAPPRRGQRGRGRSTGGPRTCGRGGGGAERGGRAGGRIPGARAARARGEGQGRAAGAGRLQRPGAARRVGSEPLCREETEALTRLAQGSCAGKDADFCPSAPHWRLMGQAGDVDGGDGEPVGQGHCLRAPPAPEGG